MQFLSRKSFDVVKAVNSLEDLKKALSNINDSMILKSGWSLLQQILRLYNISDFQYFFLVQVNTLCML